MALTPKGEARRTALLDAVVRVLEREGPGGVTHRSVALEAGVPVAAATYYFASLDELYVSALRRATREQVTVFAGIDPGDLRAFARVLYAWAHEGRGAAIAQYELMFEAMRRESLREDAVLWYRSLELAIDPQQRHPHRSRVVALAVDGLLLRMLWLGEPSSIDEIETALRQITSATSA